MPSPRTYATAGAFRRALEERLKRASLTDQIDLNRLRRQVSFDRLLARLFREEPAPWVLKGGYALELRFKAARSTVDIDLTLQQVGASRKGCRRLTRADLESQALCVAQCEQLYAETTDGELKLNERREAVARLRGRLGLSTHATTEVDPTRPAPPFKRRRPGQRLPTRDVIGQMDASAAAL